MDQIIMFVSQLFNGLKIGSVYALVALGYTMVYGIIDLALQTMFEIVLGTAVAQQIGRAHV